MRQTKRSVILAAFAAAGAATTLTALPAHAQFYGGFGRQGSGYLSPMPSGMGPFSQTRGGTGYPMSQPMPSLGGQTRYGGSFGFTPRSDNFANGSPFANSSSRFLGGGEPRDYSYRSSAITENDSQPEYRAPRRGTLNGLPPDRVDLRPAPPQRVLVGHGTVNTSSALPPGGFEISGNGSTVTTTYGPALLGGYYYGAYCDGGGIGILPSVFNSYDGFPAYIDSLGPGVAVVPTTLPAYDSGPQEFSPPVYNVTYNQTNYYVASPTKADEIDEGGAKAKAVVKQAYPADSYQAAFADIEKSWTDGDISLISKHLRSNDTKISVFLSSAYKYSLNSSDFTEITRDAFDRLSTDSFKFTELQKATNGDVTAYGTHVYRPAADGDLTPGDLTPFDADADASSDSGGSADQAPASAEKTVYVSYTLRHGDNGWYIVSIDSSREPLVKADSQ